jgi:hypothetical protein
LDKVSPCCIRGSENASSKQFVNRGKLSRFIDALENLRRRDRGARPSECGPVEGKGRKGSEVAADPLY